MRLLGTDFYILWYVRLQPHCLMKKGAQGAAVSALALRNPSILAESELANPLGRTSRRSKQHNLFHTFQKDASYCAAR